MTNKVFWNDPYLTNLDTVITSVEGNRVTVRDTIFYAFSGGQESDTGSIGKNPVEDAIYEDGSIVYVLSDGHNLQAGDSVSMSIDWQRRYDLMRLHIATEIVLELFYRKIPSIKKIGAHISENKARIDFFYDRNLSSLLTSISEEVSNIIHSGIEIDILFSDRDPNRRFWKIKGFAQVPCCGTHVRKTSEIGALSLKRKTGGKNKERVEIYLKEGDKRVKNVVSPNNISVLLRRPP